MSTFLFLSWAELKAGGPLDTQFYIIYIYGLDIHMAVFEGWAGLGLISKGCSLQVFAALVRAPPTSHFQHIHHILVRPECGVPQNPATR